MKQTLAILAIVATAALATSGCGGGSTTKTAKHKSYIACLEDKATTLRQCQTEFPKDAAEVAKYESSTSTTTTTQSSPTTVGPPTTAAPKPVPPAPAKSDTKDSFTGDGVRAVGTEISAGLWKTDGNGGGCMYAALDSPDLAAVGTELHLGTGSASMQLGAGKYFYTSGCGEWHRVG